MKIVIPLLIFIGAAALVITVSAFSTFYQGIKPAKIVSNVTPADFGLEFENLNLTTQDGLKLDAWYVPAKNRTNHSVIVLHGYPFDKGSILATSIFLQDRFNLLFFDFRYLGRSEGKYTSIGYHEQKDMEAAVKYLRERDQEGIGVYGFSMGGAVALMGAESNNVDAVVADSPYASLSNMLHYSYRQFGPFRLLFTTTTAILTKLILNISIDEVSPAESVKEMDVPVLVIHGTEDDQVPVENAHQLKAANKNIELQLVEGANHSDERDFLGSDYERKIIKFFRDNLS